MISYETFLNKTSFNKQELLSFSWGRLVNDPPSEGIGLLPSPPMLMFDRITHISHEGNKGTIIAEQDIALDDWFFQCHFTKDPVQPGCLGVDAVWQLLGFYGVNRGAKGAGRALAAKEIEFFGQIRPHNKLVKYEVNVRRYVELPAQQCAMIVGSAVISVDGEEIYTIKDAKVGIFEGIQYTDYPANSKNSVGGKIE